jgi:hypothetical protein
MLYISFGLMVQSYEVLRYQPKFGHALSHYQCSRICPKLPKIAKIFPKTISFRNFEMPPKIEILVFLKNKKINL